MNWFWGRVRRYMRLLKRWSAMLCGRSYWHAAQGLGKRFVRGELRGYFNDLTAKTAWSGPTDDQGLPLNERDSGDLIYFATTLFQKALGHWDQWLDEEKKDSQNRDMFFRIAEWAVDAQDEKGGWKIWPLLGLDLPSPYSAMTQGEGISVLVRAHMLSGNRTYLEVASRALEPLFLTVERGGTRRVVPEGSILEEVPSRELSGILNGWVFALFGLYDVLLVEQDMEVEELLEESLRALWTCLPRYNAGYWSYLDLSGNLASPFYHQLYIAQLAALEKVFPQYGDVFASYRVAFTRQHASAVNRLRAMMVKAFQKMKNPPEAILR